VEIFEAFGIAKHPRLVIVNIYEGNDFRDAYRFHEWRTGAGDAATDTPCPFSRSATCDAYEALSRTPLGRHSYTYNLVAGGLWHLAADAREHGYDFRYDVEFRDGTRMPFNTRNGDLNELEYAKRLRDGAADLDVFDDAMRRLAGLAGTGGFQVVLAYTPGAYTAYGERVRFHARDVAETMAQYSARQRAYFAAKSKELGFAFVDMTGPLAAAASELESHEPLYFRTNSHLTVRGHEVLARALAREPLVAAHEARGDDAASEAVGPPPADARIR
jgi:hypothetical protein